MPRCSFCNGAMLPEPLRHKDRMGLVCVMCERSDDQRYEDYVLKKRKRLMEFEKRKQANNGAEDTIGMGGKSCPDSSWQ